MKIKQYLAIILLLGLMSFAGCTDSQNETKDEAGDLVFKSYIVPERLAKEISRTINELLRRSSGTNYMPPIGRARIAPDGQLLVAAPKGFHDGVKSFIEQLKNANPEPSPSATVNYWIVAGRKAKTPAKLEEYKKIRPALESIQNNQGNMEFKLLDHVTTTSSGQGTGTHLDGQLVQIRQTLSAYSDGSIIIDARVHCFRGGIDTQIETKDGELVVLGQLSQEFRGMPVFDSVKEEEKKKHVELVSVYYIISASIKK